VICHNSSTVKERWCSHQDGAGVLHDEGKVPSHWSPRLLSLQAQVAQGKVAVTVLKKQHYRSSHSLLIHILVFSLNLIHIWIPLHEIH
jgi:hypothetical protein